MTLKAADAVTHREPASFSLWMLFGGVAGSRLS
jgi:hypothetical protein